MTRLELDSDLGHKNKLAFASFYPSRDIGRNFFCAGECRGNALSPLFILGRWGGGGDGDGDFGIVRVRQMDIARSFDRAGGAREIR